MFVDTHTHIKNWSPDATQDINDLLNAASKKGLSGVTITDHYELGCNSDGYKWVFDTDDYYNNHLPFRCSPTDKNKGDRVGFLVGIEIGFKEAYLSQIKELIKNNKFDVCILSLHEYDNIDPVRNPNEFFTSNLPDIYSRVINAIADSAEAVPEADVIGHYDFISRYCPARKSKIYYDHAPEAFNRLFKIMIQNNQALEINTSTIENLYEKRGYSLTEAMPDPKIIKRYRQMGGNLFTLGSDAHQQIDVARYFSETAEWLLSQGITKYSWYENHKAHFQPLRTDI